MKLDAAYLNDVAKQTGFDPYNIEKVLRLKELLRELERLSRALRDPSLADAGFRNPIGNQKSA